MLLLMYTGKIWTNLFDSKYVLPPNEMKLFYLDQNYGKKCLLEALFQF